MIAMEIPQFFPSKYHQNVSLLECNLPPSSNSCHEILFWGPLLVCSSKSLRNPGKMSAQQRTFAVCRCGWWRVGAGAAMSWWVEGSRSFFFWLNSKNWVVAWRRECRWEERCSSWWPYSDAQNIVEFDGIWIWILPKNIIIEIWTRFGMLELEVLCVMCLFHGIPNRIHYPLKNRIVWVVCSHSISLQYVSISIYSEIFIPRLGE